MKRVAVQTRASKIFCIGLALATNIGCASPGDEGCPPEDCGFNSSKLADEVFGELDIEGTVNSRGVSMMDFQTKNGASLTLDIAFDANGTYLIGLDPHSEMIALSGSDLKGSRIVLNKENESGSEEWFVSIDDVGRIDYLSNQQGFVRAYRMRYGRASEPTVTFPLCPNDELAIVIAGERYDERTLTIEPDGDIRYFRLACASDMLGKTRRASYDPLLASSHPYATTAAQRRATLAMLGADYCGTGTRFTKPGVPLFWQNHAGWMVAGAPPKGATTIEAGWNASGVTCLDTPRLEMYERADIEAACRHAIPTCTPEILATSEWVTWAPFW